jgi:hypothetical protein
MALPSSGPLSFQEIATELGVTPPLSLAAMSTTAGFTAPFAVTDFYGYSPTVESGSFLLTNVGNYVTTNNTILPPSQTTFTIECWIYMTQYPTVLNPGFGPPLIGDMTPTDGINYWSFGPRNTGRLSFNWFNAPTSTVLQSLGDTVMSLNTWYHIAISVNSNSISLFVGGVLQTLTGATTLTNRAGTIAITTIGQVNGANQYFYGYISNMRMVNGTAVYTSSFTPPTAPLTAISGTALLMNTVNGVNYLVDSSTNNYTMTATGTVPSSSLNPF